MRTVAAPIVGWGAMHFIRPGWPQRSCRLFGFGGLRRSRELELDARWTGMRLTDPIGSTWTPIGIGPHRSARADRRIERNPCRYSVDLIKSDVKKR